MLPTDLIILTADSVFFYAHTHRLLQASDNGFNHLVPVLVPGLSVVEGESKSEESASGSTRRSSSPSSGAGAARNTTTPDPIITLPESSVVVNIVLHTVYGMSCSHYSPTFTDLSSAVDALSTYGISLHRSIAPSTPLFTTLLDHAPDHPMEVYTLAAKCGLHALAVAASPHLLSYSLPCLTDELASVLGGYYTKKLFFLHLGRIDALKRLLLPPPHPHPESTGCDFVEQKKLTRAWALAAAYLAWDARPGETELY